MNWEAIGALGELAGAAGVIASLIYLALQIRQNSSLIQQATVTARVNAAVTSANHGAEMMRAIALNGDAFEIWSKGYIRPDGLNEAELRRFDGLLMSQVIQMDVNHYLYDKGALDAEIHAVWEHQLETLLANPRFQRMWEGGVIERLTTASFSAYVRRRVETRRAAGGA